MLHYSFSLQPLFGQIYRFRDLLSILLHQISSVHNQIQVFTSGVDGLRSSQLCGLVVILEVASFPNLRRNDLEGIYLRK